jgi:DNA-binding beta-propeller fold protein YncE
MSGSGWTSFGRHGSATGEFDRPQGIAIDQSDHIYVVDGGNARVVRIDDITGTGWVIMGRKGDGAKQFDLPFGIAVR